MSTLPALLRLGADLEAKDRNGKTPLFQCTDNEAALQLLLAAGANVDIIYSRKPRSIGTCFSSHLRFSFFLCFALF
jgi:ankyrin repeat protein